MKKSTFALATLLTTLSVATLAPIAYADDTSNQGTSTIENTGCSGCKPADSTTETNTSGAGMDSSN